MDRIPLNLFGIPFGLAGLGGVWMSLASYGHAPEAVGDAVLALAAATWLTVLAAYLRSVLGNPRGVSRDLLDPIGGPFASLAVITPMLLAAEGVFPHAATIGRVLLDIFLVLTVLLGAWFTGQWIYGPLDIDQIHPGYFLPTVAGGLIASAGAAEVGQHRLAEVMFGLGTICWLVLGSIILTRLLTRPLLPVPLLPTLAIEVAPAAVATLAWFQLRGDVIDPVAAMLGGYGLLMVIAQLRLLPAYARLPFMTSTWAFTFSWAAVATAALHWVHDTRPTEYSAYDWLIVVAITGLIGGIAVRTVVAVVRGQLLPRPVAIAEPSTLRSSPVTPTSAVPEAVGSPSGS